MQDVFSYPHGLLPAALRNKFLPADKGRTIQFDQGPFPAANNPLKTSACEVRSLPPRKAIKPTHAGEVSAQQRFPPSPTPPRPGAARCHSCPAEEIAGLKAELQLWPPLPLLCADPSRARFQLPAQLPSLASPSSLKTCPCRFSHQFLTKWKQCSECLCASADGFG